MVNPSEPLRWFRVLALAAHLVVMPIGAGISIAGDEPAAESVPPTLPDKPVEAETPSTEPVKEPTAIDKTHDELEQSILDQVVRLDSFFGNPTTENKQKTNYQLRWRTSVRVEQDGHVKFGTTLRAYFQLSKINKRLHLVILGEDEPDTVSARIPDDPGNPVLERGTQPLHAAAGELRYYLTQTPSLDIFLGAGVRLIIPPEAFVRSRFQYTHKISDVSLLRCTETLFVKKLEELGETSEIDLERKLDPKNLLRWSSTGTVSSEITGLDWATELSLIRELSARRGITFTGGVYGNTSIKDWVNNYRILARYRQNFFRSWLFYELEPEISWPKGDDNSFRTNYALTFRIEVTFQGKEK